MVETNLTGKVMTVKGPIDPDQMGITLMHEHLFHALLKIDTTDENTPVTDYVLKDEKLGIDTLYPAFSRKPITDNWIFSDVKIAIEEVMEFRTLGGDTVVEVTNTGFRRDPMALLRVANATGLNIVMGSGWYQKTYHPADMDERSVEELADEIIRDITVGVTDTGIRSGIIGEVGVEGNPIEPNEVKSIRASARASRKTGAAITLHRGGWGKETLETISILSEESVDLSRVIFGHCDIISANMPLMLKLLKTGVYVEFDVLGRPAVPLFFTPPTHAPRDAVASSLAAMVAEAIPKLIEAGYIDRVLLSQDICTKLQLKRYGGSGYSYILETFLPHLRSAGVAEEHIQMMMVENPKRVLPLSEPVL